MHRSEIEAIAYNYNLFSSHINIALLVQYEENYTCYIIKPATIPTVSGKGIYLQRETSITQIRYQVDEQYYNEQKRDDRVQNGRYYRRCSFRDKAIIDRSGSLAVKKRWIIEFYRVDNETPKRLCVISLLGCIMKGRPFTGASGCH